MALQPVSWSIAAASAGSVYTWLGVHVGLRLGSGRVNTTWKKCLLVNMMFFFSKESRCVCGIPGVENIPAIHCLTGLSLQLALSNFSHTCFEFIFHWFAFEIKCSSFLNLLSRVPARRASGFESLGGCYQSLTQGLFAVRLHTWAETPGQGHMCLKVGGSGWTQYGASLME